MVYFEIEEFDNCINDCDRAKELNKEFIKVSCIELYDLILGLL
jgi:hypothetical protein